MFVYNLAIYLEYIPIYPSIINIFVAIAFLGAGLSKIPEALILVSILSVSESELVSADGIDS